MRRIKVIEVSAEEKLARLRRAREILVNAGEPGTLWFLAGGVPCDLFKGSIGPIIFEDRETLELVTEFLEEMGPTFPGFREASLALLGKPYGS